MAECKHGQTSKISGTDLLFCNDCGKQLTGPKPMTNDSVTAPTSYATCTICGGGIPIDQGAICRGYGWAHTACVLKKPLSESDLLEAKAFNGNLYQKWYEELMAELYRDAPEGRNELPDPVALIRAMRQEVERLRGEADTLRSRLALETTNTNFAAKFRRASEKNDQLLETLRALRRWAHRLHHGPDSIPVYHWLMDEIDAALADKEAGSDYPSP